MIVGCVLCSPNVVKQLTKVIFTSFVALSNPTFVEFLVTPLWVLQSLLETLIRQSLK